MPSLVSLARAVAAAFGAPAGWLPGRRSPSDPRRPGRVATIRGIVFQSDARSLVGDLVIRPFELADRWVAGVGGTDRFETLANHAGIHVVMADGGDEVVVEQLVGSAHEDFVDGLNWTPIERFRARDRGGWDATVPATAFRGVDGGAVAETVARLNAIEGHPFVGEDCTQFVERAFGGRRLFADSPVLQRLGLGARVGDPALPLLRPGARFEPRAEALVRAEVARALPDPLADHAAPNVRLWLRRGIGLAALGAVAALALVRARQMTELLFS
jgi:hypothetical protein